MNYMSQQQAKVFVEDQSVNAPYAIGKVNDQYLVTLVDGEKVRTLQVNCYQFQVAVMNAEADYQSHSWRKRNIPSRQGRVDCAQGPIMISCLKDDLIIHFPTSITFSQTHRGRPVSDVTIEGVYHVSFEHFKEVLDWCDINPLLETNQELVTSSLKALISA
jgi:hypothetical protein